MTTPSSAVPGRLAAPCAPRTDDHLVLHPLGIDQVEITGGFWGSWQDRNRAVTTPHALKWLERDGAMDNLRRLVDAGGAPERRGMLFSDSDLYKALEGIAWDMGRKGSPELAAVMNDATRLLEQAQQEDGYLNSWVQAGKAERFADLTHGHEMYCAGHLIQAAVAHVRTTGSHELLDVARKLADHLVREFGERRRVDVDGHPEIETALVELYRLTGERRYLDQARRFVERRGHGVLGDIELGRQYFQDDQPVRETTVMTGHAVRALYLASAAADLAIEDDDAELLAAVALQTVSTLARRTYLTGGMGAHHEGESFGLDHELPPDRAYSETCAGVASVMLNHRLLLATGRSEHADAVERTLYNVVATSPAADGRAFYYTNTLHQRTPGSLPEADVASARASSSLRAPWFEVSCCPTNVTRTVASLGAYVASVDGGGVQLHQYAPSTVRTRIGDSGDVVLRIETGYPLDGAIRVTVVSGPRTPWTLSLRVPAWAHGAVLAAGGEQRDAEPGYATVTRAFEPGEVVELHLPVVARWTWPDARVDAVRGQVAVERGPLVLCLESTDLGASVNTAVVRTDVPPLEDGGAVKVAVSTLDVGDAGWPYGEHGAPDGPGTVRGTVDRGLVSLIPYRQWANRGPSTMRVWMPTLD